MEAGLGRGTPGSVQRPHIHTGPAPRLQSEAHRGERRMEPFRFHCSRSVLCLSSHGPCTARHQNPRGVSGLPGRPRARRWGKASSGLSGSPAPHGEAPPSYAQRTCAAPASPGCFYLEPLLFQDSCSFWEKGLRQNLPGCLMVYHRFPGPGVEGGLGIAITCSRFLLKHLHLSLPCDHLQTHL